MVLDKMDRLNSQGDKEGRRYNRTHILLAVCIIVAFIAGFLVRTFGKGHDTTIQHSTVGSQLTAIQDLATYSYTYYDAVVNKDSRTIAGVKMPGTERTIVIAYSGVIKVMYDLAEVNYQIDETNKIITIDLPEPKN